MRNTLENEILRRGLDDILQLAELISIAYSAFHISMGSPMMKAIALSLHDLLVRNLVIVGNLDSSHLPLVVSRWPGDPDSIVRRVISDWTALGHDPGLSEVCWLQLTDEGREAGIKLIVSTW
jgi:hypothetical protein